MKRILKVLGFILASLIIIYLLGPRVVPPKLDITIPEVSGSLTELEANIQKAESQIDLKPDNQARIIWADSIPGKTEYCLVYIPGFTATYMEGDPVHQRFAQRYGCNLYLPRLHGHGMATDNALINYSADSVIASATHALAVGQQLGEKVILMSTSTGGTLSLQLAAIFPEQVDAIITYSPNIKIADPSAVLLSKPWGLQIARAAVGDKFRQYEASDSFQMYWYTRYRLEGLAGLQALLDATMLPSTFKKVAQPIFMGYYYKNEEEQDQVVSVPAMLDMFEQLGTPKHLKQKVAFENVGNHAIASKLASDDVESVCDATFKFAEDILKLKVNNGN